MKKIISFVTTVFILIFATIPAFAAEGLPYVVDNAGLLTEPQAFIIEEELKAKSEELSFDIVVLTVDSLDGKTAEAYADDYYDYTGYGVGENHDGCLLLVSMTEREWHLSTTGFGITALTDAGIDYIGNKILSDLSNGDYYNAFDNYSNLVYDFVTKAYNGLPYDYDNLNQYDSSYDANASDGKKDTKDSFGTAVICGVVAGLVITLIIISILRGKMKTVYHKTQANEYLVQDSLVLTGSHDIFLTKHVTRTAKESSSGKGGSSTHSGSSGTSHGGGGGHF